MPTSGTRSSTAPNRPKIGLIDDGMAVGKTTKYVEPTTNTVIAGTNLTVSMTEIAARESS